jgi:hypothetical protein
MLTPIFDEYRRFAGSKARLTDQQFIELFDVFDPVLIEAARQGRPEGSMQSNWSPLEASRKGSSRENEQAHARSQPAAEEEYGSHGEEDGQAVTWSLAFVVASSFFVDRFLVIACTRCFLPQERLQVRSMRGSNILFIFTNSQGDGGRRCA